MKTLITLFTAALLCSSAVAQEKSEANKKKSTASTASGPAMPKPASEMKDLRALVGTWNIEVTFEQTPMMPGGTATGTNTVRLGPGGFTVLMENRSKGSWGALSGHGVLTWDPNEKAYKTYWSDSMTPGVTISTGHQEGENIVYTGEVMMGGKKMSIRDVVSDRTPTSYTMTEFMNDGSGEKQSMTIKCTKQEASATPPKK
jgi:hypothetical protein